MKTSIIGYPRVGANRELKFWRESYFKNELSKEELLNCDFTQANKKIKEFREKSYKYLCDALGE